MITCKEDLINTRIDATNKELLTLYVDAAEKFGITLMNGSTIGHVLNNFNFFTRNKHCCISSKSLFARGDRDLSIGTFDNTIPTNYKVLTLADFYLEEVLEEPKQTKTNYTPLNFKCASEAVKFIEDGGVFYCKVTEGVVPFWMEVAHLQGGVSYWDKAYKKDEVVQEWFTEVVEYCETVSTCSVEVSPDSKKLGITGIFTKDQLVMFAELISKNKDL